MWVATKGNIYREPLSLLILHLIVIDIHATAYYICYQNDRDYGCGLTAPKGGLQHEPNILFSKNSPAALSPARFDFMHYITIPLPTATVMFFTCMYNGFIPRPSI